jgi:hypothetical protein
MRLGSFGAFHNAHGFGALPVCIDDPADRIGHQLRVVEMNVVGAVRVRDVLGTGELLGQLVLRRELRRSQGVSELLVDSGGEFPRSQHFRCQLRLVGGEHDRRDLWRGRRLAQLLEGSWVLDIFSAGDGRWSVNLLVQGLLLRGQPVPDVFGEGVDEDEPGYLGGVGAGVEPDDRAAIGVSDEHVRTRFP